ncbi:type VI secretion system Vgr family protein [Myroides sp. DW712]|uniref:type VI secretion system Vgr family protein n=1 Tax=Myroides sp. DW712 TaxID=3389800 RepID=UPI00397C2E86
MSDKSVWNDPKSHQTQEANTYLKENPLVYSKDISNANAIANHLHSGVTPLVDVKIVIEGVACKGFKKINVQQSSQGHHSFVLIVSPYALGKKETYHLEQTQELLGKRLRVRFTYKYGKEKPERDFIGVITAVSFEQSRESRGDIVLEGYSPTILLDRAPHIQSFGGSEALSLQTIVHQLVEEGYAQKGKYNYEIHTPMWQMLSYSCQYNETAYNYLVRMAEAYGMPFFYDGEVLHFGAIPRQEAPIPLVYGRDVDQIKVEVSAQHVNRELYGYDSLNHEYLNATSETNLQLNGTLAKQAYERSQRVFTAPSVQAPPIHAQTTQAVTLAQQALIGHVGMRVFTVSGTTTVPFLYPGCIVELSMFHTEERESHFFTKLMITHIVHEVDALGTYNGRFEAVDAETGYMPTTDYQRPIVEQQIATVVNNADPQQKGRVQVQFDWQQRDLNTAFIRVVAPDAGSSNTVDTNRGFVAIPEVGDQVLVGFINQDPDHPIVLGGLFHGKNSSGGGKDNNLKSWSTKSGHRIALDDAGGIQIADKKNNVIQLDGAGEISVKSTKSIVLQTGKSSFVLDEDGTISLHGIALNLKGETISNLASQKLTEQSGNATLLLDAEENEAMLSAKSTTINGASTATLSGGIEAKVSADGTAAIEGAIVKLN